MKYLNKVHPIDASEVSCPSQGPFTSHVLPGMDRSFANRPWCFPRSRPVDIIINFEKDMVFTGIMTKGGADVHDSWVTSYRLEYAVDSSTNKHTKWVRYQEQLGEDKVSLYKALFPEP